MYWNYRTFLELEDHWELLEGLKPKSFWLIEAFSDGTCSHVMDLWHGASGIVIPQDDQTVCPLSVSGSSFTIDRRAIESGATSKRSVCSFSAETIGSSEIVGLRGKFYSPDQVVEYDPLAYLHPLIATWADLQFHFVEAADCISA